MNQAPANQTMTDRRQVTAGAGPMPALGLGLGQLCGDRCYRAVRHALDLGYRHLDTAHFYGNEDQVGRAIRDSGVSREEIFLTTKVWRTHMAADRVAASVQQSLRALGLDYVDLLLAHWPVGDVPLAETMTALRRARDAGQARHVGVSNFTPAQVRAAAQLASVFCNQVEYHPLLGQDELLAAAADLGHILTAYSPIAQGAVAREPVICRVAERHGKSPAQIALRWLIQQPRVAAIPRSGSAGHRAANIEIFDFALSDEEMSGIHRLAASRRLRLSDPGFAPDW